MLERRRSPRLVKSQPVYSDTTKTHLVSNYVPIEPNHSKQTEEGFIAEHKNAPIKSSLFNAFLAFAVVIPPILLVRSLQFCTPAIVYSKWWDTACDCYANWPITFVNLMYFVVVDVFFWLIYLIQGSTWLIDPHWQIIPCCIALFYYTHPNSAASTRSDGTARAYLALFLLFVWAIRLMHNYLRRENWQFGAQEDWRYSDMRIKAGKWWWLVSFFAVSVAQHPMLVGLTLPLLPAMHSTTPLGLPDLLAVLLCVCGVAISYSADNTLWNYMQLGPHKPIVLNQGLWQFSRHPNHFGEQLYWIGLLLLGWAGVGVLYPYVLGVLFNHPIDIFVTCRLIEKRMLSRPNRREAYLEYQRRTSYLVPLPASGESRH